MAGSPQTVLEAAVHRTVLSYELVIVVRAVVGPRHEIYHIHINKAAPAVKVGQSRVALVGEDELLGRVVVAIWGNERDFEAFVPSPERYLVRPCIAFARKVRVVYNEADRPALTFDLHVQGAIR